MITENNKKNKKKQEIQENDHFLGLLRYPVRVENDPKMTPNQTILEVKNMTISGTIQDQIEQNRTKHKRPERQVK